VFYGPAPRSRADEARARIAAEHEAARVLREAEPPERAPLSQRFGSRCPICLEDWNVNAHNSLFLSCCCRIICASCSETLELRAKQAKSKLCPLCRTPEASETRDNLKQLTHHVTKRVPEAVFMLGDAYDFGELGVKSKKRAKMQYEQAVELGNVMAMWRLGKLLWSGDGVKMNRKKAKKLFRMAADRGLADAQDAISRMLLRGEAFEAGDSKEEGFRFVARAANQGYTPAEFNLGVCYLQGTGVECDLDKALFHLSRAAAQGHEKAKDLLDYARTIGSQDDY